MRLLKLQQKADRKMAEDMMGLGGEFKRSDAEDSSEEEEEDDDAGTLTTIS